MSKRNPFKFMIFPHEIRTNLSEIKGNSWRILFIIFLLMPGVDLLGQEGAFIREKGNPHYQEYSLEGGARARQSLQPENPFSSVAFTLPGKADFENAFCVVEGDTFKIEPAAHQPEGKKGLISNLLVMNRPQKKLQLFGDFPASKGMVIHFMYAEPFTDKVGERNQRKKMGPCEEPVAVPQSVWRKGLPEPEYTRSFNEVDHQIIHHSASGNNTTNYTEEVRNYYLYHTQANGWSDIGYNYLIAPDGTLYAGRDPGAGEQDNVTGAHFCGKNSGTMGICLIGDYTSREPTTAIIEQLEQLLIWKSYKEGLNPLETSFHSANPDLGVIAGHRDGCATLCPGDNVYKRLPELRMAVKEELGACEDGVKEEEVWVYFAPKQQEVCLAGAKEAEWSSFVIYNMEGKRVTGALNRIESNDFCVKLEDLAPGLYLLQAARGKELIRKKIVLL